MEYFLLTLTSVNVVSLLQEKIKREKSKKRIFFIGCGYKANLQEKSSIKKIPALVLGAGICIKMLKNKG